MPFSNTASNTYLRQICGKTSSTNLGSTCYMGLSTTTPNADGTNFTEPSASNGYARSLIGLSSQSATQVMGAPVNGTITNTGIIFFPEATASWGTITYFGLFSAETGGDLILYGALSNSVSVPATYVPIFKANNFSLTLT